jgi:hypothetical protein
VAARVDEYFFGFKERVSDLDSMRRGELSMAGEEMQIGSLLDLFLFRAAEAHDDFILLRHDRGEIRRHVFGVHAPALRVPCVTGDLRAMDHRFGWCASRVDARPAKISLFDERDLPPKIHEA